MKTKSWLENKHWILKGRRPVRSTLMQWARWFEKPKNKRVKLTKVGPWQVSTIFMGLDHNFSMKGAPVLFETMIFASPGDPKMDTKFEQYQTRCSTYTEALKMHARGIEAAKAYGPPVFEKKVDVVKMMKKLNRILSKRKAGRSRL